PAHERVDLEQVVAGVALDDGRGRSFGRLVAANRGDPEVHPLERALERRRLPQVAASIGVAFPERRADAGGLRLDRLLWTDGVNRDPVALLEGLPEGVGLGEEQAGVEGEDVDRKMGRRDQVDEDAAFDAKSRAERGAAAGARGPRRERVARRPLAV